MKSLIYELFSGVGFCNQLFSLETAIYLANISNRKLILLIRNPLCHCGRASWDYGRFLDFFSDDYKEFLPHGLDVYYGELPSDICRILNDANKCYHINYVDRFSRIAIVDKDLDNSGNSNDIKSFLGERVKSNININDYNDEYIFINQSNASRCFYNFYTTPDNYRLMSKICSSLTKLHSSFYSVFNSINLPKEYISIHFRFGDVKHDTCTINNNSEKYYEPLTNIINDINSNYSKKLPIIVMCDRGDADLLIKIKNDYDVILTTDLIKEIDYSHISINSKRTEVLEFLIQKLISDKSDTFIGHDGSTVSNYINYMHYLLDKPYYYYLDKKIQYSVDNYTWTNNNYLRNNIGWRAFFSDNIYKHM